jgi:hypothetical protein
MGLGYGDPRGLKSACLRSWVHGMGLCVSDRYHSRMQPDSQDGTWSLRVFVSMDVSFTLPDAGRAGAGTIFWMTRRALCSNATLALDLHRGIARHHGIARHVLLHHMRVEHAK